MTLREGLCPCCSDLLYWSCCARMIEDGHSAKTPLELMRSRYTAYSLGKITYISGTMRGPALKGYDAASALLWANECEWRSLEILDAPSPKKGDQMAEVEFIARYVQDGQPHSLHERSQFEKHNGRWYYTQAIVFESS